VKFKNFEHACDQIANGEAIDERGSRWEIETVYRHFTLDELFAPGRLLKRGPKPNNEEGWIIISSDATKTADNYFEFTWKWRRKKNNDEEVES
jgi:hypothetical protein